VTAKFSAKLFGLPDITWGGTISKGILNNAPQPESDSLQEPSPASLLGSLGSALFKLGDGIPILGPLSGALNQPLPLINRSVAQLTGLAGHLPKLPTLPAGFANFNGNYHLFGDHDTLTVNVTPATI